MSEEQISPAKLPMSDPPEFRAPINKPQSIDGQKFQNVKLHYPGAEFEKLQLLKPTQIQELRNNMVANAAYEYAKAITIGLRDLVFEKPDTAIYEYHVDGAPDVVFMVVGLLQHNGWNVNFDGRYSIQVEIPKVKTVLPNQIVQ